jgi:hypothetical protein
MTEPAVAHFLFCDIVQRPLFDKLLTQKTA